MAAEIRENPSRYLCALGYFSFASLIDIKSLSPAHSLYIHSASEPYNEEMILNHERVDNNCLDSFGVERHPIIHCSGHARSPAGLFRIMTEIDAASVSFPVHTHRAPRNARQGDKKGMAAVVEEGETYTL
jgi:ribonuclease J